MSLQFNVSQLLKSGIGETRAYPFTSDVPIDLGDGASATEIHGEVKLTLTNLEVLARGHADACVHQVCARCVEPFDASASITFDEEFQPTIDIATGLPTREPVSDSAFRVSQNHTIDLTEAIRQNLVVAMDMIPVCSEDCQGLCPTCGVNWNLEACECPSVDEASPFAALQGLLGEGNLTNT